MLLESFCQVWGGWSSISSRLYFSIKKTYHKLQGDSERVEWRRMVCNNKASPKSISILWLSLLNRVSTATRLHQCDINVSHLCRVYDQAPETLQHLFFSCSYNKEIWKNVLEYINWQPQVDAQEELV